MDPRLAFSFFSLFPSFFLFLFFSNEIFCTYARLLDNITDLARYSLLHTVLLQTIFVKDKQVHKCNRDCKRLICSYILPTKEMIPMKVVVTKRL
jgi:hypothetical protein